MAALVLRMALINRSRSSEESSHEFAAAAKFSAALIVLSSSAVSSVKFPPEQCPATAIR
jgi:hypothetical protein